MINGHLAALLNDVTSDTPWPLEVEPGPYEIIANGLLGPYIYLHANPYTNPD